MKTDESANLNVVENNMEHGTKNIDQKNSKHTMKESYKPLNLKEPLSKQKVATQEARKFHQALKMIIKLCCVCHEAWPVQRRSKTSKKKDYTCTRCLKDKKIPKKFSKENCMVPSSLPPQLKGLTQCEEMLIARSFPVMLVYTRPGAGYLSYKGHVITLPHNVQKIATVVPNLVQDIPIVRLQCKGIAEKSRDFTVRREKVLNALSWLVANNKAYRDVIIDNERINNLPVEGNVETTELQLDISDDAIKIDTGPSNDDEFEKADVVTNSFVPSSLQQPKEKKRLNETIQSCEMEVNCEEPFNEFETPYLASMSFPTLFPDCKGDPFFTGNMREIAKSDSESFALKLKHLIKFAEKEGETWSYRFAAHPRFGFWAYNILMRRRILQQGSYYIKQHPSDAALNLDDLKEMLANDYFPVVNSTSFEEGKFLGEVVLNFLL